jgi:hypothetical protein
MGLDMYLSKKTYVQNWDFHKPEEKHTISIKKGGKARKDIKPKRVSYIVEEVMYWRNEEQLEELASICEEVVVTKNTSLLETQGGFFFGGTDYDEYYFEECKNTAKQLRKLLAEETPEGCHKGNFYYQSSW